MRSSCTWLYQFLVSSLFVPTNFREGWLDETTWNALALTYETSMMTQNFGNISLHISK